MNSIEHYNKHYIATDTQGRITSGWSDGPHPKRDTANVICINEQGGYQFRLFPGGEENPPLCTMDGIPLYKWDGESVISRTEEEIEADRIPPLESVRVAKLAELSTACNTAITAGCDVQFGVDSEHFNLSIEDQSNIANLFWVVELGGTEFPYQADGGKCRIYTAQEIAQIYIVAQTAITTQITYHNALKAYVQSLDDAEQIAAVQYGMTLPDPYASEVANKLNIAQTQMNAIVERLNK